MGDMQLSEWRDITVGVVREDNNTIANIVFDGVDVSILRIHVDAAVELDIRFRPTEVHTGEVFLPRSVRKPRETFQNKHANSGLLHLAQAMRAAARRLRQQPRDTFRRIFGGS